MIPLKHHLLPHHPLQHHPWQSAPLRRMPLAAVMRAGWSGRPSPRSSRLRQAERQRRFSGRASPPHPARALARVPRRALPRALPPAGKYQDLPQNPPKDWQDLPQVQPSPPRRLRQHDAERQSIARQPQPQPHLHPHLMASEAARRPGRLRPDALRGGPPVPAGLPPGRSWRWHHGLRHTASRPPVKGPPPPATRPPPRGQRQPRLG